MPQIIHKYTTEPGTGSRFPPQGTSNCLALKVTELVSGCAA